MLRKRFLSLFLFLQAASFGDSENCPKNQVFQLIGDNVRKSLTLYCPESFVVEFYIELWQSTTSKLNCSNHNFCKQSDIISEHRRVKVLQKESLKNGTCTNLVFENATEGHYCAKLCSPNPCGLHTTTHHLKYENDSITVEPDYSPWHRWIVFGIGVLLFVGLTFLVYKCYCNHRRLRPPSITGLGYTSVTDSTRQNRDIHTVDNIGQILILYNYDNDKHFKCVQRLAELLRSFFTASTIVIDRECTDDICRSGVERWVRSQLNTSDRVIVISSEGASDKIEFRNQRMEQQRPGNNNPTPLQENSPHPDTFLFGWTAITNNASLSCNYKKLLHARFEYTKEDDFTPYLVPQRYFVLPSQVDRLLEEILGHSSAKVVSFLSVSRAFQSLIDSIEVVSNNSNNNNNEETHWIRPGI